VCVSSLGGQYFRRKIARDKICRRLQKVSTLEFSLSAKKRCVQLGRAILLTKNSVRRRLQKVSTLEFSLSAKKRCVQLGRAILSTKNSARQDLSTVTKGVCIGIQSINGKIGVLSVLGMCPGWGRYHHTVAKRASTARQGVQVGNQSLR